jgi:pimeloyl-ACP methyl ester carboxylesterase
MSLTNYIYGSLVWVGIGCISCFSYIVIGVSSLVMIFLPSAQMKRHISEHMTDIVSTYGFREETVDVSGVKIHCVIKDNVTEHGLTSGGGGASPSHCATATDDVFVFIHGTASASIIFFDVMKHIPSKCVAIDLPNFGISGCIDMDTHNSNEAFVRCYADIIGNTLIALDIMKNTILVAHSLGGFLSIYTAERYPVKRLVLLNPAGILPTLGIYGYYWGIFFKAGLPTTLFHLPMISRDLLIYIARCGLNGVTTEFWLSFFTNNENNGHEILQRLITLRPFYSYWNTPAINTLLDVYKKVPTHICFGEDDTIIPSHIGEFLDELTGGEIMIHNIKNASHNPCCNIECFLKYICAVRTVGAAPPPLPNKTKWRNKNINKQSGCRGYSYHCLKETNKSIQNIYNYIITNHHQS